MNIHPLDWLAELAVWTLNTAADLAIHISGNVAHLGPFYVAAYWLAVLGCWRLGQWGNAQIRAARKGFDFAEFASGRARWVGKAAVLFEFQVRWDAWKGYAVLGYPLSFVLLAVGALGPWTLVLIGGWVTLRAAELHRARRRRLAR